MQALAPAVVPPTRMRAKSARTRHWWSPPRPAFRSWCSRRASTRMAAASPATWRERFGAARATGVRRCCSLRRRPQQARAAVPTALPLSRSPAAARTASRSPATGGSLHGGQTAEGSTELAMTRIGCCRRWCTRPPRQDRHRTRRSPPPPRPLRPPRPLWPILRRLPPPPLPPLRLAAARARHVGAAAPPPACLPASGVAARRCSRRVCAATPPACGRAAMPAGRSAPATLSFESVRARRTLSP